MKNQAKTAAPRRRPNADAADRTGHLFNPGKPAAAEPLTNAPGDYTLRVVRGPTSRACLMREGDGETLCGRTVAVKADVSSRPAGPREGYCNACASKSAGGVVR